MLIKAKCRFLEMLATIKDRDFSREVDPTVMDRTL